MKTGSHIVDQEVVESLHLENLAIKQEMMAIRSASVSFDGDSNIAVDESVMPTEKDLGISEAALDACRVNEAKQNAPPPHSSPYLAPNQYPDSVKKSTTQPTSVTTTTTSLPQQNSAVQHKKTVVFADTNNTMCTTATPPLSKQQTVLHPTRKRMFCNSHHTIISDIEPILRSSVLVTINDINPVYSVLLLFTVNDIVSILSVGAALKDVNSPVTTDRVQPKKGIMKQDAAVTHTSKRLRGPDTATSTEKISSRLSKRRSPQALPSLHDAVTLDGDDDAAPECTTQ